MTLRYEATQKNEDTLEVRDVQTGKRGFYRLSDGAYKMGELRINLRTADVLDELYWNVSFEGGE